MLGKILGVFIFRERVSRMSVVFLGGLRWESCYYLMEKCICMVIFRFSVFNFLVSLSEKIDEI